MATAPEELAKMYPWLPPGAIEAYTNAYNEGSAYPWADVRADSRYEEWFPGNLLPNGDVRHTEANYAGIVEGFDQAFAAVRLSPEAFRHMYGDFIQGDISPDELYMDRIKPQYERVVQASDAIRQAYSQRYGIELTDGALLASVLDPALGQDILEGRIDQAEVIGEAMESGFQISETMLDQLLGAGFDRGQADELFSSAANILPTLSVLARRHSDPEDEFDLNDFVASQVFSDPDQRRKMRNMVRAEQAQFANAGIAVQRDRAGSLGGLEAI